MQYNFSKTAVVYSQEGCQGCAEAKELLERFGYTVEVRTLGIDGNATKKQLMEDFPDARSIPQIILNNQKIGTLATLKKFLKIQ
jgi:glutaredoxin